VRAQALLADPADAIEPGGAGQAQVHKHRVRGKLTDARQGGAGVRVDAGPGEAGMRG
jgi:hypothetical protein